MPKFAANLTMMFNEVPFPERFAAASKAGFKAVEFLLPYDHPAQDVMRWLRENGLESVLINLPPGDWTAGERGLAQGDVAKDAGSFDQKKRSFFRSVKRLY
jgi:hydroxypyruvate isomerase